jgi:hypothetical protein
MYAILRELIYPNSDERAPAFLLEFNRLGSYQHSFKFVSQHSAVPLGLSHAAPVHSNPTLSPTLLHRYPAAIVPLLCMRLMSSMVMPVHGDAALHCNKATLGVVNVPRMFVNRMSRRLNSDVSQSPAAPPPNTVHWLMAKAPELLWRVKFVKVRLDATCE